MNTNQAFDLITKIIMWLSSLGAGGIFIVCLFFRKLTKGIISIILTLVVVALIFYLISNHQVLFS